MKSAISVALLGAALAAEEPHDFYPHVIGGVEVSPPGKYSFLVALNRKGYSAYQGQFCGGAIIAENKVATAAHCCDGFKASDIEVLVNWHDLEKANEGTKVGVKSISMYGGYNDRTLEGDVCTLTLTNNVPSSATPIELDTESRRLSLNNEVLTVIGWGNTNPVSSSYPSKAQHVGVPYVANEVCNDRKAYNGEITSGMLCAGVAAGGIDACQGDSGGPLIFDTGRSAVLVGIVSWGYGCAQPNKYGVYARVSTYANFLQNNEGGVEATPKPTGQKVPEKVAEGIHGLSSFKEKEDIPHDFYPHIIGGQEISPPLKYKFLVPIVRNGYGAYDGQFCGGSIVSEDTVLTAAHCCDGFSASQISVVHGIHDLNKPSGSETIGVASVTMHPDYNPYTIDNDVCTLKLNKTVPKADAVTLDDGKLSKSRLTTIGWGNTNSAGRDFPNVAHEVNVPHVSNEECNQESAYNGEITDAMNCAGYITEGGKDACQGDSGGPIFMTVGGDHILTGVTSWGYGCAQPGKPGVYADVPYFRKWIEDNIRQSSSVMV